jgi:transcriptional regulator with XRE-family HTH domain
MKAKINDIGMLFLKRRKSLGLTQQELGDKVGVSKSEISKIENGRAITISTINKLSEELGVYPEISLRPADRIDRNIIYYISMCLGRFSKQHNLSRREACNYLSRFKGLQFAIDNYEVEHQLSLQDCVDDMTIICKQNGGGIG